MLYPILGFHMTSRPPCWCPDQILWEFNSIIMQTLPFVSLKNMAVDHVSENQQFLSPGLRFFVLCICVIMWHSNLNDMEITRTKRFIPKGFELGTTLS